MLNDPRHAPSSRTAPGSNTLFAPTVQCFPTLTAPCLILRLSGGEVGCINHSPLKSSVAVKIFTPGDNPE